MKTSPPLASVLEIRMLPIEQLVPAHYNPRKVLRKTDKAYKKLEKSLREFGLVEPLVWNERTGHVVGGHARLAILRSLGATEVPVSVVQLSEVREKALNVVLNNQEAQSRYDPSRLADLLDELDNLPELELTGFDPDNLPPLRWEKLEDLAPLETADLVTITLETNQAIFEKLGPKLDELVTQFHLTSHVRRR